MERIMLVTPYYYPNIVGGAEISTQLIAESVGNNCMVLTMDKMNHEEVVNNIDIIRVSHRVVSEIWKKVLDNKQNNVYEKIYQLIYTLLPHHKLVNNYRRLFVSRQIKILVVNSNIDALGRASIWKASKQCGIKTILVLRDPILLSKKIAGIDISSLYKSIIRRQMQWIDAVVAPSQYMIDLYSNHGFRFINKKVIPNAVDIDFIVSDYEQKEDVAIYAGSIREEKGIITLINAINNVNNSGRAIQLKVFGKGPLESECIKSKYIKLLDWIPREELYKEMKKAKIVILPSEYPEAFGRIIIESIAEGTLAIGSDSGGIPEILNNDNRYVYKTKDIKELEKRIIRILCLDKSQYYNEIRELQASMRRYDLEN